MGVDDKVRPEPRSAVMIVVEVSWEDQNGTVGTVRAQMENKSVSGACIRIKRQVGVGSKLRIQWRWDDFLGVAKHCRPDGKDYLVGLQRDTKAEAAPELPESIGVPLRESTKPLELLSAALATTPTATSAAIPAATLASEPAARHPAGGVGEIPESGLRNERPMEKAPSVPTSSRVAATGVPTADGQEQTRETPRPSPRPSVRPSIRQELDAALRQTLRTKRFPLSTEAGKESNDMGRKWLELGNWGDKQGQEAANGDTAKRPASTADPAERSNTSAPGEDSPAFQAELLVLEDVYQLAGIVTSRKGYSITKVVEMLRSEHLRGLAKDAKRASVLMALDAAGISVDEMLEDAKMRLEAIDSYEAEQRNRFEADWARKSEENTQIQTELEAIKARYMDRLRRNQDGVARQKATFGSWLTSKQQETQNILEAVELCLKPAVADQPSTPASNVSVADAIHKPV
jgi:hypothetical protein